jgi:hypothetical protein
MELLRLSPYADVEVVYTIPASYTSNEDFTATITDMADLSVTTQTVTDNAGYVWTITLPGRYDSDYQVVVTDASGDTLSEETYELRRPYVDPNTLGATASEIETARLQEELARAVIDSVIPQGFYYKKINYEVTGLGADYIPLWVDAKKILSVYENNALVTDREYEITKDKTAITYAYTGTINRMESAPNVLPAGASDLLDTTFFFSGVFPKTFDYRLVLEAGYTTVPSDIVRATKMLIDDISCGKLEYYKKYISSYSTDQYKLQFDKRVFEGTGNILVDKILSKYAKSITRLGVL